MNLEVMDVANSIADHDRVTPGASAIVQSDVSNRIMPRQTRRSRSQSLSVRSEEADMKWRPSGLTATALTPEVCAANVYLSWAEAGSQSLRVPSSEAERTCRRSAVTTTAVTSSSCPLKVCKHRAVERSQNLSVPSSAPETA